MTYRNEILYLLLDLPFRHRPSVEERRKSLGLRQGASVNIVHHIRPI